MVTGFLYSINAQVVSKLAIARIITSKGCFIHRDCNGNKF